MLAGHLYDPLDPELVELRSIARDLFQTFNSSRASETIERRAITRQLFRTGGDTVTLEPPFYCDYGCHIRLGEQVYFNFNCVILDVCEVHIGDHTFIGPGVQIYTATHPLQAHLRRTQEFGKPITIGSDVWIGGGAIVCPGVRIGSRSVIGAGSVVTRDIAEDVLAVGNPCRVVRVIDQDSRQTD
ncbi:sugar O-acetyltransferase [Rubinisphaera sp. ICM_H10]|nr:sugar O-acetyltransferase [Rubinisphaera margarita]MCG6156398.1 sugar O-acetyltransferase [Rubinisphaera margarita]